MADDSIDVLIEKALAQLMSSITQASAIELETAAHSVTAELPYDTFCSVRDGLESRQRKPALHSTSSQTWRPSMFTAAELQTMEFPPRESYVEGLIVEGLTILGGKPKLGKSWWALRAAVTVASGGVAFDNPERVVTRANVLYLALEDAERRLQQRLKTLLQPGEMWPDRLTTVTEWPKFNAGGVDLLADIIDTDGYEVVFIDTLGRVRTPRRGRDSYQEDTDAIGQVHELTRKRPGLSVVLIHHNRKDDSPDDYIDALSGTTGITGVVDHIAVLQRSRGEADATLRFTSRDEPEHDTAYGFDRGVWSELGSAAVHELSKARRELYEVLAQLEDHGEPTTLTELASLVDKTKPTVLELLRGLHESGLVYQDGDRGPWKVANSPNSLTDDGVRELGKLGVFEGSGTPGEPLASDASDPTQSPPDVDEVAV